MKKHLLLTMVIAVGLFSTAGLANDLQNPGFELANIGWFGDSGFAIPSWTFWGDAGWVHNNPGAFMDTKAILMWSDSAGVAVYQDLPIIGDREYKFSGNMYSPSSDNHGLHGRDGYISVEWYASDPPVYENRIYTDEVGIFYGALTIDNPIDPYNTWKNVSCILQAPSQAVCARFYLHLESNGYDPKAGVVSYDNLFAGLAYVAENPSPANNGGVDPTASTTLKWEKPAPRQTGDTILCDVYFGTDPEMPGTNSKVVDQADVNSFSVGYLQGNTNYYWKVVCYDGATHEIITEGYTWTFNTENAPPVVDAGTKKAVWLTSGTATVAMNALVTDDGLPVPPGALTYTWTLVSGTGTASFNPSTSVLNPNVTFDTAGDYVLKLTAFDGDKDANDTVMVRVYAQGYTGLRAYWPLNETSGTTAVDVIGGHNGTLVGNPVWTAGKVNGAIQLDGDGDYINCGGGTADHNTPTWADIRDEITISAWVKGTFDKNWQAIIDKGDTSWRLFRDSTGGESSNVSLTLNGVGPVVSGSTGPVGDNKWHQVVGTFDGAQECIYVDGVLANSRDIPFGAKIDLNNFDVYIGGDDQFEGREFTGLIDEVKIYEIGLPVDMVLAQFIADGGTHSCGLNYLTGDVNKDCYVDFADFAQMAENWLKCSDVTNSRCD